MLEIFKELVYRMDGLANFAHNAIEAVFDDMVSKKSVKLGKIAQPVRVALTGGTVSPGIFEVIETLGKDETITRLNKAIAFIESTHPQV